MAGAAGAIVGIATVASGQPVLGLIAGGLSLTSGALAWTGARSRVAAEATPETEPARSGDLTEELSLARLREQALQQRIELLENAARAAASGAAGLAPVPGADGSGEAQLLLTDPDTGLFSESYFEVALEARIAAARRRLRPVALVLIDVVRGASATSSVAADATLVTGALRRTLREADTACRLGDGRFALVLEDTPENGAIWTVERVRSHLAESGITHTLWAGIACYPAHAFDKDEILEQAREALRQARVWRQDRIEVATAD